jgi:simple sugar transport system permease protein
VITPEHRILDPSIIGVIFRVAPEMGIVAVGLTILMIAQEFDLSVGSTLAFCSMIFAWSTVEFGFNPVLSMLFALAAGCIIGFLNAIVTTRFGILSLITTLGTMMWWRGMVLVLTGGHPEVFYVEQDYPAFYAALMGNFASIPVQMIWFVSITAVLWIVLEKHKFGNHVFATGGNKEAARAMGINTNRTKTICFVIVGVMCGLAGVMQTARIQGSNAIMGTGMELVVIAAAVIGGTSLSGGTGTIWGTLFGIMLLQFINAGLLIMRVPAFWYQALVGLVIVVGSILNTAIEKRRGR